MSKHISHAERRIFLAGAGVFDTHEDGIAGGKSVDGSDWVACGWDISIRGWEDARAVL